jgi:hypothetical protein
MKNYKSIFLFFGIKQIIRKYMIIFQKMNKTNGQTLSVPYRPNTSAYKL